MAVHGGNIHGIGVDMQSMLVVQGFACTVLASVTRMFTAWQRRHKCKFGNGMPSKEIFVISGKMPFFLFTFPASVNEKNGVQIQVLKCPCFFLLSLHLLMKTMAYKYKFYYSPAEKTIKEDLLTEPLLTNPNYRETVPCGDKFSVHCHTAHTARWRQSQEIISFKIA
jgi:hypothetical protein